MALHSTASEPTAPFRPQHPVRIVTAASLFDGHDAAINIMRRILQATGPRSSTSGTTARSRRSSTARSRRTRRASRSPPTRAATSSTSSTWSTCCASAAPNIKVFGGGGGTILPEEIEELHAYGVARIYSPDDGRELGLQGMINDLLEQCDFATAAPTLDGALEAPERAARRDRALISLAENEPEPTRPRGELAAAGETRTCPSSASPAPAARASRRSSTSWCAASCATSRTRPSRSSRSTRRKRQTGGALLGDRIRMNAIDTERVYMRSLATRQANLALSEHVQRRDRHLQGGRLRPDHRRDRGIGQSDTEIIDHCDVSLYVMTAEYGAATQLEKIDMLDFADLVAINKFDKRGASTRCATCASRSSATASCSRPPTTSCRSTAPSPRSSTTRA